MIPSQLFLFANHLWQSTLFAAVAGLLTLLLRANRAQVRYWVWLSASLKFLIPFSILVAAGGVIGHHTATAITPSQFLSAADLSSVMEQVSAPFTIPVSQSAATTVSRSYTSEIVAVLIVVWAIGFVTLVCRWTLRWWRMRASVCTALPNDLPIGLPVKSSPAFGEPGVFGVIRPVLLLPDGIVDSLTAPEMEAILAHELCHVRRRDNLATAIHMAVEVVFWFHPLVWWLGARLMEERERACDEEVLRTGTEPRIYAEGILKICELYLASPLACVAGVTGGDLKRRIEAIMSERVAVSLNCARKVALTVAGLVALSAPVTVGIVQAPAVRAQSPQLVAPSATPAAQKFEVASIKPVSRGMNPPPNSIELNFLRAVAHVSRNGRFNMKTVPVSLLIQLAYNVQDSQVLGEPSWTNSDRYDVVAKADSNANFEQMRPMLQSLLTDRFKLRLRRETRELPVYELAVAKGGLKIEAAKEGSCVTFDPTKPPPQFNPNRPPPPLNICGGVNRQILGGPQERRVRINAIAVRIPKLIEIISDDVRRIIVDNTGFNEKFDVHLEFAPSEVFGNGLGPAPPIDSGTAAPPADPSGVSIFSALQQQLGLRLRLTKLPVEVLVIDHVERPSEN
jgi:bla regulator protein BlaR1